MFNNFSYEPINLVTFHFIFLTQSSILQLLVNTIYFFSINDLILFWQYPNLTIQMVMEGEIPETESSEDAEEESLAAR